MYTYVVSAKIPNLNEFLRKPEDEVVLFGRLSTTRLEYVMHAQIWIDLVAQHFRRIPRINDEISAFTISVFCPLSSVQKNKIKRSFESVLPYTIVDIEVLPISEEIVYKKASKGKNEREKVHLVQRYLGLYEHEKIREYIKARKEKEQYCNSLYKCFKEIALRKIKEVVESEKEHETISK